MLQHVLANQQISFFVNVEHWFDDNEFFYLCVGSLHGFGDIVTSVPLIFVPDDLTGDIVVSKTNFNDLVDSGIVSQMLENHQVFVEVVRVWTCPWGKNFTLFWFRPGYFPGFWTCVHFVKSKLIRALSFWNWRSDGRYTGASLKIIWILWSWRSGRLFLWHLGDRRLLEESIRSCINSFIRNGLLAWFNRELNA